MILMEMATGVGRSKAMGNGSSDGFSRDLGFGGGPGDTLGNCKIPFYRSGCGSGDRESNKQTCEAFENFGDGRED